ncbi:uncharacterized protein LOC116416308 [Nasonia vitripennis]|uniref:Transposable element P transposase-like RNase H C-terminal domain-containing protein n=1 Tax=Nasonia vitripennis TaxID=7425 RepID=A0A7M7Q1A5_NASVI|nr:uncharacterized protein LOC116416308 [Nasonia vitripennis]
MWEREKESDDDFLTASTAEGLRVTLHSSLQLAIYLLEYCDFKYVLTNKMNQDCLEQFFGIIRLAKCQNDHPTFPTFMQHYHLLSVYKILRPPKYDNCTVRKTEKAPTITLDDFQAIFNDSTKSYRQKYLQI